MSETEKSTPDPQQGVHMDFHSASDIIQRATSSKLVNYAESGLGYNNRIYYCEVEDHAQYVLKVCQGFNC